jgi:S1-C subfamily serine protease
MTGRRLTAVFLAAGVLLGAVLTVPVHHIFSGGSSTQTARIAPAPQLTAPPPAQVVPSQPTVPTPGSNGGATSLDTAAIAAKVDPGIVDINTQLATGGSGAGTGMLLTSNGRVLTNNHVINGASTIVVTLTSTGRQYKAQVTGTDPTDDVAVLQLVGASGLSTVPLGSSSSVAIGDQVVALGNAGGRGGTPAVATGVVTALHQGITADDGDGSSNRLSDLIETDAPIQPGDSGGPLVNAQAQVIGMDTAASVSGRFDTATTTSGFAITIDKALSVAKQIVAGHASSKVHLGLPGLLGVSVSGTISNGVTVGAVQASGPAARAGIAAGDIITSIDGVPVQTATALVAAIKAHRVGETATVAWTTATGAHRVARVTLAAGPAD